MYSLASKSPLLLKYTVVFFYILLFEFYGDLVMAQSVMLSYRVFTPEDRNVGPVIQVSCSVTDIPPGTLDNTVKWIFYGTELSENTQLLQAGPSRYSLSDEGYRLNIRNALQEDQGSYTCRFTYRPTSESQGRSNIDDSIDVIIESYLPPLNYPECSIEPILTNAGGGDVTFNCDPGFSEPPVNLVLILERKDGSNTALGTVSTTRMVTIDDDGGIFTCYMTSNTFPTVNRNCSAGPIVVLPTTIPPTTTTTIASEIKSTTKEAITSTSATLLVEPFTSKTTTENSETVTSKAHPTTILASDREPVFKLWGVVGGAIGAMVILIILIFFLCVFIKRRRSERIEKSGESTPRIGEMINMRSDKVNDTCDKASNGRPVSTTDNSTSDTLELRPVYASVNKANKTGEIFHNSLIPQLDEDAPVYEDTAMEAARSKTPAASSDPPVYGKVNKGYNKDPRDDAITQDGSGFVDNIIYTPSGPFAGT